MTLERVFSAGFELVVEGRREEGMVMVVADEEEGDDEDDNDEGVWALVEEDTG